MTPSTTGKNKAHIGRACIEHFCQLIVRNTAFGVSLPDSPDLISSKFAQARTFAARLTALAISISHVVAVGAFKQVRWVAATRVIASVAGVHTGTKFALMKFVAVAVNGNVAVVDRETPVAVALNITSPRPAGVRAAARVYVVPEAFLRGFCEWSDVPSSGVVPLDEAHGLAFYSAMFSTGVSNNRDGLPAAAFAEFRGMLYNVHVFGLLNRLKANPGTPASVAGAFCA